MKYKFFYRDYSSEGRITDAQYYEDALPFNDYDVNRGFYAIVDEEQASFLLLRFPKSKLEPYEI